MGWDSDEQAERLKPDNKSRASSSSIRIVDIPHNPCPLEAHSWMK
jgi:hypothetical protein